MIANQDAGFVFFHIPKCAGLTVHRLFRQWDDFHGGFYGTRSHPDLNSYDGNHVPPAVLQEIFPDAFRHIAPLDKFAIIRNPQDRFRSAMAQRIRQYTPHDPERIGTAELEAEVARVMDYLPTVDRMPQREFAHFMRQSDFVELHGQRFIGNLYPISRAGEVIAEISDRLGVDCDPGTRYNVTRWRCGEGALDMIRSHGYIFRFVLPKSYISWMRRLLYSAMAINEMRSRHEMVFRSDPVQSFVERHYARDFALWAEATGDGTLKI